LKFSKLGFELDRGFIAEGGMEPTAVIDGFEEGADAGAGVFEAGVGFAVDLLVFGRPHETLSLGVVVRVAGEGGAAAVVRMDVRLLYGPAVGIGPSVVHVARAA
jgi:hypothetical protein